LRERSPVSQEPTYNAQRRFSPAAFEATRTKMLTELLEEEGPGDDLVEYLRAHPESFTPDYLESYRRSRNAWDEVIANRRYPDADLERIRNAEAGLARAIEKEPDGLDVGAWESVLKWAKEEFEKGEQERRELADDPVSLHALARHRKHRYHSMQTAEECPA